MIDGIIIIIMFAMFILIQIVKIIPEVKSIINLTMLAVLFGYLSLNIGDVTLSRFFGIIGVIFILLIPGIIIILYLEKIK